MRSLLLLTLLWLSVSVVAQDDNAATALARIEAAAASNASALDLSGLGLTELPPELFALTDLQELDLSENALTTLPPDLGDLTALRRVALQRNQLTSLPPTLANWSQVCAVLLNNNQLTTLPPELHAWAAHAPQCDSFLLTLGNNPLEAGLEGAFRQGSLAVLAYLDDPSVIETGLQTRDILAILVLIVIGAVIMGFFQGSSRADRLRPNLPIS